MADREKILIIEHDDFLREIVGNLLHKKGFYILNAPTIQASLLKMQKRKIDTIILGTSCPDYKGKQSLQYIKKNTDPLVEFFILNNSEDHLDFIPETQQMKINELSIQKILNFFESN